MLSVAVAAGVGLTMQLASKTRAADVTGATATHLRVCEFAHAPVVWMADVNHAAADMGPAHRRVRARNPVLASWISYRRRRPGHADGGTAQPGGTYLGYLNVTPRQGPETLQDWHAFRLTHLGDDDAVSVHEDATVRSVEPERRYGHASSTITPRPSVTINITRWPVTSRAALSAASWSPPRHQVIPAMSGPNWSAPSRPIRSNRAIFSNELSPPLHPQRTWERTNSRQEYLTTESRPAARRDVL